MNLDLIHTDDDDVAPVRTPAVLREDVRQRVQRARRRRRLRQATLSGAGVAVWAVRRGARPPAPRTTVRTPASEGRQHRSDEPDERDESDEQVEQGGDAAPPGPGAAVPGNTPATVATVPTPSVPDPLARPAQTPRDKSTEVFRSADVRLAVVRTYEVWELGTDWTPTRKLVSNTQGNVTDVDWSPDGRQLAYGFNYWTAARNTTSIRLLDLASMQSRIVVESSDFSYWAPTVSPDGTLLAFARTPTTTSVASGLHSSVVVVDLDAPPGNDRWEFGPGDMPSWMPDGRILFRCEGRLCISDVRGGNRVQVPGSDDAYRPEVSPDGHWVVFSTTDTYQLQVMRTDGSDRRTLEDSINHHGAHWSPDGRRIFYATNYGIRTIARDGSDLRIVTERHDEGWMAVARR